MFDKKQKSCVKRIHLVTDNGLYDRKAFYTVKIAFYSSSTSWNKLLTNNWLGFLFKCKSKSSSFDINKALYDQIFKK